jgi:hypothetical protein
MQERSHNITGKNKLQKMIWCYKSFRVDDVLPIRHEIVYVHAWVPEIRGKENSVVVSFQVFIIIRVSLVFKKSSFIVLQFEWFVMYYIYIG